MILGPTLINRQEETEVYNMLNEPKCYYSNRTYNWTSTDGYPLFDIYNYVKINVKIHIFYQ